MPGYVELQVTSNYSFLRGGSHVEELFVAAKALGLPALAITDHDTLAGIARAHARAAEIDMRLVVGCRLALRDGLPVLAYPTNRAAYGRLCRLLTLGKGRTGKGGCDIGWQDLLAHGEGLLVILLPDEPDAELDVQLRRLHDGFPGRGYLSLSLRRRPGDQVRLRRLHDMAQAARVPTVVTGDVLYHAPERRILQDVVTCIREGCTIDDAGFRRERFADRHLKSPDEMARLFDRYPEALARTGEIAGRCTFSLSELRYQYPDESEVPGETPQEALERQVRDSVPLRYPDGLPPDVDRQLRHELGLIRDLEYAPYFLTVNSIVRYARSVGILCQGRGSAANSAVCYVLGITSIDPVRSGLLFERFISAERREPPDIDVDFESERREEVIQWVYERYGRDRAALCATVMRFRARGAVRDVGKVMGLSEDVTGAPGQPGLGLVGGRRRGGARRRAGPQPRRPPPAPDAAAGPRAGRLPAPARHPSRRLRAHRRPAGRPRAHRARGHGRPAGHRVGQGRHRRAEVHEGRRARPGDARLHAPQLRAARTAPRRAARPRHHPGRGPGDLRDDPPRGHAGHVPDREPGADVDAARLKPTTFYDLVVQVAIVRPGPIQGDMVHPYLRRREGIEKPEYPRPELKAVLGKTLGVPLFQEQAMQVAIHCAGFTPGEADQLRRSMATFKVTGGVSHFKDKLITGMVAHGYEQDFAERTFSQLEGFGSYGFPESHAASFALVAYASSWMKCHHPEVFCCGLLNSQPMGFYAPAQVVRDAVEHGVDVRPVCANASRWDCTLEPTGRTDRQGRPVFAVRLGLRMARGLSNQHGAQLVAHRGEASYVSVEEVWRRADIPAAALERLAEADAFRGLGLDRRQAMWAVKGLADTVLPLFAAADRGHRPEPELVEPAVALVPMKDGREVVEDYRSVGLSLRRHPVAFLRAELATRGMVACADLTRTRDGRRVVVPGIVLVRQKPGSAKGVMFMTIEDETGVANLILWPDRFERQRRLVLSAGMVACHGRVQREGEVTHVITDRLEDLSDLLRGVGEMEDAFPLRHGRGDGATHPGAHDPRDGASTRPVSGKARDIHAPDRRPASGIKVPTRDFR